MECSVSASARMGWSTSADRSSNFKRAYLHIRYPGRAGTGGGSWGVVYRGSGGSARVLEEAGVDGGEIFEGPVLFRAGRADVPDGGLGEMAGGRQHRVFGAERFSGKDPWISDRVGGDRGAAGGASGCSRGGGNGARGHDRGQAAGGLLYGRWRTRGTRRGRVAISFIGGFAGVHGTGSVCAAGESAVDSQREAGSQGTAGAGGGCLCATEL